MRAFIEKQDEQTKAKFVHLYNLLRDYGPQLAFPHSKHIINQIYELRIAEQRLTEI